MPIEAPEPLRPSMGFVLEVLGQVQVRTYDRFVTSRPNHTHQRDHTRRALNMLNFILMPFYIPLFFFYKRFLHYFLS